MYVHWMHLKSNWIVEWTFSFEININIKSTICTQTYYALHRNLYVYWCCRFCNEMPMYHHSLTNQSVLCLLPTLDFPSISSSLSCPLSLTFPISFSACLVCPLKIITQINFVSFIIKWEINCDLINSILWLLLLIAFMCWFVIIHNIHSPHLIVINRPTIQSLRYI